MRYKEIQGFYEGAGISSDGWIAVVAIKVAVSHFQNWYIYLRVPNLMLKVLFIFSPSNFMSNYEIGSTRDERNI